MDLFGCIGDPIGRTNCIEAMMPHGKQVSLSGLNVILAFIVGFAIAQISKVIFLVVKTKFRVEVKDILHTLIKSGGMPSGHAASFTAAVIMVGFMKGFLSAEFAISLCTLFIILYDAVNVRWAVGEQGKVLSKLVGKDMRIVEGHTAPQVFIGIIIGILSAFLATLV